MVAQDGTKPKDGIETLKNLGRVANWRTKSWDIFNDMCKEMKLDLDDDFCWVFITEGIKNISNQSFNIVLGNIHVYLQVNHRMKQNAPDTPPCLVFHGPKGGERAQTPL